MNMIELLVTNTQHRIIPGGVAIAQTTLTAHEYEAVVAELIELGYPPYSPPPVAPSSKKFTPEQSVNLPLEFESSPSSQPTKGK
jgi:hypothetical protein